MTSEAVQHVLLAHFYAFFVRFADN